MANEQRTQLQRDNDVRRGIGWILNHAIDCDAHRGITIAEVKHRIRDGSIWTFLTEKLPNTDLWSLHEHGEYPESVRPEREAIRLEWEAMADAIDERELLVSNNGICLLLSYLFQGLDGRLLRPSE